MSNKVYYKRVSKQNDNLEILSFDTEVGGGIKLDLVNLTSRVLVEGEVFPELFEISEFEYASLAEVFFLKLGIELQSGNEQMLEEARATEEEFEEAMEKMIVEEEAEEKTFEPKVAFSLMHKDIQVGGFSERTTLELIAFIHELKMNEQHMLIKNIDGEIVAMIDYQTVLESSFEFEEF